jgi:ATP-binding cassette subfamily F protein uup
MATPILTIHDLHLAFGERMIFNGLSLAIEPGHKVGLIGDNGAGKSTLVKVIMGLERAQRGDVAIARQTRIGWLPQVPELDPNRSARSLIAEGLKTLVDTIAAYEAALMAGEDGDALLHRIEELGGFDFEHRIDAIADALHIGDLERPAGEMSGGQQKRVALARMLLENPDLILLDEPTNHLDVETVEWLEQTIARSQAAWLIVTHDRYFLDRAVTHMAELRNGTLQSYRGDYEAYLESRAIEEERRAAEGHRKLQLLKTELEWSRRQPKARTVKSEARLQRVEALADEVRGLKAVTPVANFDFGDSTPRLSKTVIRLEHATIGYDRASPLVENFDLIIGRGERLGIVGRNGAGKSSLLKVLHQQLSPLAGEVVFGPETITALFDQHRSVLDDDTTIHRTIQPEGNDTVYPGADGGKPTHIAAWLARFAFSARQLNMPVRSLSGGERNRLALARFLLTSANVMLLDEPTNDLDLTTLAILEEALLQFHGTVILVSHDRYFLDRVATRLVAFEDWPPARREVFIQPGGWTSYRRLRAPLLEEAWSEHERRRKEAEKALRSKPTAPPPAAGLSAKEKKELQQIEVDIAKCEAAIADLDAHLTDAAAWEGNGERGRRLTAERDAAQARLGTLMARWEDLAARA